MGGRRSVRVGPGLSVKKAKSTRVRASTKSLTLFWLTPTDSFEHKHPPFCPDPPTEAMVAPRDAVGNFAQWRPIDVR